MTEKHPTPFNREHIRQHFAHAAPSYDEAAVLQKAVAEHLDERLDLVTLQPARILDVGAGTGILTQHLLQRYPKAKVHAVDLAHPMLKVAEQRLQSKKWPTVSKWLPESVCENLGLKHCPAHLINADAYALPFADGSMDLVVSNLMLQWCDDLDAVFREFRRVLRPEGLLLFTTFGPDTLKELRAAWQEADPETPVEQHVNLFIDMHDIGDALIRAGFGQPVMDNETFTLTYEKPIGVLKDLKAIGATSATQSRQQGLMGKQRFTHMLSAYQRFEKAGRVPATYEVVHGHAWAAPEIIKGPNRDKSGVHEITLDAFVKQTQNR
jgi:malonyl-CoA O-methyltransferase